MMRPNAAIPITMICALHIAGHSAHAQNGPDVAGMQAAVVSDHPLASAAGADVLRRGGNAVDAAITMAAVLAVVRPHMNGLGGDAFVLYRDGRTGKISVLNGSGRAGSFATPQAFQQRGLRAIPDTGMLTVTIPGAVRAWSDALKKFGTIKLADALEPAIAYADNGFPVSRKLAADIAAERALIQRDAGLAEIFLPGGKPPEIGSILQQHDLAASLRAIAEEGADVLYAGMLAQRLAEYSVTHGGLFNLQDLANHSSTWQEPIATDYHGLRVVGLPPNSQGVALLMQLNVAELFQLQALGYNSASYINTLVEIKKRVFAERDRYVADPAFFDVPLDRMLSKEHARDLARELRGGANAPAGDGRNGSGDTVLLCVVDKHGNAVALIQSLFGSFGSGRMVPGTGIVLHNRGALFSLDPASPNLVGPHKRPYHTLAPGMVLRGDQLYMVFGSPGSDGQTQTMLQVLNNIVLFGMTPQQAVDAPRFRSYADGTLLIDAGVTATARAQLAQQGLALRVTETPTAELGGAQVILLLPGGAKMVGADHRREAAGIAW